MKKVGLLLLCFLAGCLGHAHRKGLYSEESHFGREYNLPKDVGEKESSVLLEEAYPTLTRRFYGSSSQSGRSEYGSYGDHDVVGEHEPAFGEGETFSTISEHGVSQYMTSGQKHSAYPDHGVVISDSVAKKIGLYDKDYLKKLGLDSKDNAETPNGGSGEEEGNIPKEDVKKEKDRMKKIGVEEYRNGKHKDDKKQMQSVKDVFGKEIDTSAGGINYNKNGVMVDKKLAEKLGLYDKDYLKKLGIWEEKGNEDEDDSGSKGAKGKKKVKGTKSDKTRKRTLHASSEDAPSSETASGDNEASGEGENAEWIEDDKSPVKRDQVPVDTHVEVKKKHGTAKMSAADNESTVVQSTATTGRKEPEAKKLAGTKSENTSEEDTATVTLNENNTNATTNSSVNNQWNLFAAEENNTMTNSSKEESQILTNASDKNNATSNATANNTADEGHRGTEVVAKEINANETVLQDSNSSTSEVGGGKNNPTSGSLEENVKKEEKHQDKEKSGNRRSYHHANRYSHKASHHLHHHQQHRHHKHKHEKKDKMGVKRQLVNFIHPTSNNMEPMENEGKGHMSTSDMQMMGEEPTGSIQGRMEQNGGMTTMGNMNFEGMDSKGNMEGGEMEMSNMEENGGHGNGMMEGNPKELRMAMSGGHASHDGAMRIVQNGPMNSMHQEIPEVSDYSDASARPPVTSEKSRLSPNGELQTVQEEPSQSDASKYMATTTATVMQNDPSQNVEQIIDNPHKFDVFIDGNAAESTKLERPGTWKVGGTGLMNKPESMNEMLEKMVPNGIEKGVRGVQGVQGVRGGSDLEGIRGVTSLIHDVTPSDNMINQILKNGDRAIESNDGRQELKTMLTIRSDKDIQNAALSEDSLKNMIVQRSGSADGLAAMRTAADNADSPLVQDNEMGKPIAEEQMNAVEGEENADVKNMVITGESRHQILGQGEPIQSISSEVQDNVINPAAALEAAESEVKEVPLQTRAASVAETSEGVPEVPVSAMRSASGVENDQLKTISNLKTDNSEMELAQGALEQEQQQQSPTPEFGRNKLLETRIMKEPKLLREQNAVNYAQRSGQQLHFRRGNTVRKFSRIRTHTKDGQPIKSVDFDDSSSTISVGARRSALGDRRSEISKTKHTTKKVVEKQKRQFLSEPYALDQSHMPGAPVATIESSTIGATSLGSATIGSSSISSSPSMKTTRMGESRQLSPQTASDPVTLPSPGASFASALGTTSALGEYTSKQMGEMPNTGGARSIEGESSMDTTENTGGMPMMTGATSMGGIGNPMPETYSPGDAQSYSNMGGHTEHNMGETMGNNMMNNGMMGHGMTEHGMMGNGGMAGAQQGMVENGNGGNDKTIDQEMAEQDKQAADATAQRVGNLMEKTNEDDMSAHDTGSLMRHVSSEGDMGKHMMNFREGNGTGGSYGEAQMMNQTDGGNDSADSYDESEGGEEGDDEKHANAEARAPEDVSDINHDIADQIVKNRHNHENVIQGTPCVDCHTTGPIGHGAVISGSEAKKIGLNDESYLKRLGIKECKIKGPGFSEGNHGGAISDEWAKKLDGFDKKYLQQLGIPEEALEGNSASRDCKFVERIAEVMQGAISGKGMSDKYDINAELSSSNAPPDAVKNDPDKKDAEADAEPDEKGSKGSKPKKVEVKKNDDDLMKVEVEFKKPKIKEVSPVKETEKAAGDKSSVTSSKKKKVEGSNGRSVTEKKKEEEKTKSETKKAFGEEESATSDNWKVVEEEKNKAAEGLISAGESALPNVESKVIKLEDKPAAVKSEPAKEPHNEASQSEDNGSGLELLHSRDDTIRHLSEEKAIICHEIDSDRSSKLGTIHENCTVRTPNNATEDGNPPENRTIDKTANSNDTLHKVKNGPASKRQSQPLAGDNESRKENLKRRVSQLKRTLNLFPGTSKSKVTNHKKVHRRHRHHK